MSWNSYGITVASSGLLSIVVTLLSITFVWYLLQQVKLEAIMRKPGGPELRMLQILLSIVLGHGFARFILDYVQWGTMLKGFVE